MSGMGYLFVPSILFIVIVMPLWLILHYWSKSREGKGLSQEQGQVLEQMDQTVARLEQRINSLESILDEQHQGWRNDRP